MSIQLITFKNNNFTNKGIIKIDNNIHFIIKLFIL